VIVTLCGSVRFEQDFIDAQRELSRRGILCFSLAVLPQHRTEEETWHDGGLDKILADLLYFHRILHSDAILVLGNGYIGPSTSREILWANIQGKRVISQVGREWNRIADLINCLGDDSAVLVPKARETFR
jgi:hypothetical protein